MNMVLMSRGKTCTTKAHTIVDKAIVDAEGITAARVLLTKDKVCKMAGIKKPEVRITGGQARMIKIRTGMRVVKTRNTTGRIRMNMDRTHTAREAIQAMVKDTIINLTMSAENAFTSKDMPTRIIITVAIQDQLMAAALPAHHVAPNILTRMTNMDGARDMVTAEVQNTTHITTTMMAFLQKEAIKMKMNMKCRNMIMEGPASEKIPESITVIKTMSITTDILIEESKTNFHDTKILIL